MFALDGFVEIGVIYLTVTRAFHQDTGIHRGLIALGMRRTGQTRLDLPSASFPALVLSLLSGSNPFPALSSREGISA